MAWSHFRGTGAPVRQCERGWLERRVPFFVLSGFLITRHPARQQAQKPHYYRRFYIRGALRIPRRVLSYSLRADRAPSELGWLEGRRVGWPFIGLSFLYLARTDSSVRRRPPSMPLSGLLAVEEHFYLLWPTVVRALSREARRVVRPGNLHRVSQGFAPIVHALGYNATSAGYNLAGRRWFGESERCSEF